MKDEKKVQKDSAKLPISLQYPPSEDIYNKDKEEIEIDPEDVTKRKSYAKETHKNTNEEILPLDELDTPGSELDDDQEAVGSEDEENNYYSIGGDDHNDLEEDKGE